MSKATVLGKTTKADLPKEVFAEPFHQSLVHEAARADLNARRSGNASTLTRGEVAFTTAKAWRQKGTGRAPPAPHPRAPAAPPPPPPAARSPSRPPRPGARRARASPAPTPSVSPTPPRA